jgi:protein-S-isoprenylcysteine O-methyltransferase Ste14
MSGSGRLLWHALAAFLALPGMVGFVVPWALRPRGAAFRSVALVPLGLGVALLLSCVWAFYVAGRGTLAPWKPPERLVTGGLYRYSRNPMYVAVLLILCGWALGFASTGLWTYAAFVAVAFHLRVVLFEEPWLARTHGTEFTEYQARVPRWLGMPRTSGRGV